ncbi:metallophosphatase family protein [Candidatus Bipolaricaulota bacterium]|nr:metallophosphatase family protein [Candidatus Bipolaricaulota bacterium]
MRIGVISDIHANLPALDAVLTALRGVGIDRIVCCGDVVGCGPWPAETVDRLQAECVLSVRGNHDDATLHLARYRGEGHESALRMLSWTYDQLTSDHRGYLAALPERFEDALFTIAHGSLRAPLVEFVLEPEEARDSFALLGSRIGFLGHSHIQSGFAQSLHRVSAVPAASHTVSLDPHSRYLINPGSVGMPRDGDTTAAYAWLDLAAGCLTYARAPYDATSVAAAIRNLGFNDVCPSSLLASS